jgi:hypothetical protein
MNWQQWVWIAIAYVSFLFGFFLCAILSAAKQADEQMESASADLWKTTRLPDISATQPVKHKHHRAKVEPIGLWPPPSKVGIAMDDILLVMGSEGDDPPRIDIRREVAEQLGCEDDKPKSPDGITFQD